MELLKIEQDGVTYEWVGMGCGDKGLYWLDQRGNVTELNGMMGHPEHILRRVPREHRFGPIVLEETGEVRQAEYGEFYLYLTNIANPWCFEEPTSVSYPILRPVRIEPLTTGVGGVR